MNTYRLHTEIEIAAEPEHVWSILTEFPAYPEWNPFILNIEGEVKLDARLKVRIQPSNGKAMTFRPRVFAVEPGKELRWLGHFLFPNLFYGEHRFVIEPIADGRIRFTQSERFSGLLVPLFKKSLEKDTKMGFEAMNLAIKARAEA
ncbi:SRPBCC domain-containing protein [Methylomonas sp. MO1]|uniref:SRPBCC domain-containing protein n=1 Tax=Methylomonas sp. MO1 TaxID=3073619 RepID=UPI0028A38A43|nr:SRPBCC domain-containing protein [Methylomonas sp. MO1]MDT4291952.1 SRPBCC domain-containing protein [Methylomonas sp. MO1]